MVTIKTMTKKQPLIDLQVQYQSIKHEIDSALQAVLSRGDFVFGKEVHEFESAIAAYLNVKHAVSVASGTDALTIALRSLNVGPGDEVITTPFSFVASAEAIVRVGAQPVFADIEPSTLTLDPEKLAEKISPKTKAVMPVHLYGQPCRMDEIARIAGDNNIPVIEDCAQAMGAEYKGNKVGSLCAAGCFSFFPGKNLGCYGDGGLIVTQDAHIAEQARLLRNHGSRNKYEHIVSGYNSRLDTIQAAILLVKLRYLDQWNVMRRRHAESYKKALASLGYGSLREPANTVTSMNYFTCIVKQNRNTLQRFLTDHGIATGIYYPVSLHLQPLFKSLHYIQGDFPVAEEYQEKILSLPMYPELTNDQIEHIVEVISLCHN